MPVLDNYKEGNTELNQCDFALDFCILYIHALTDFKGPTIFSRVHTTIRHYVCPLVSLSVRSKLIAFLGV